MNRPLVPSRVRDQCAELVIPKEVLCVRFVLLGRCFVFSSRVPAKSMAFVNSPKLARGFAASRAIDTGL